jgi:hypothetical protein
MRDGDRAFADYNEAIRLDPKYTLAFYGRGVAYVLLEILRSSTRRVQLS